MTGRPHRVALLEPQAEAVLAGEAAGVVQLKRIEKPGVPPVLELSAATTPFDREANLDLTISYASGTDGAPFVLPRRSRHQVQPAHRRRRGVRAMSWDYYWAAGGGSDQPDYYQFQYGNCQVGCGPVAWAMLFCWGDYQAENGNSYWAGRTGLYRRTAGAVATKSRRSPRPAASRT